MISILTSVYVGICLSHESFYGLPDDARYCVIFGPGMLQCQPTIEQLDAVLAPLPR